MPNPSAETIPSASSQAQSGIVSSPRGPKLAPIPRGHVARSIEAGKRPFLTCTVSPDTFRAIDRYCIDAGVSRGVAVDRAISMLVSSVGCEETPSL